jgi:hypothetical protein
MRHRASLVGAGLLEDASEAWLAPRRERSLEESERSFEVLAEIFAAETRVDVCPRTAASSLNARHVRARPAPPPLTEEEALAAARAAAAYGAAGLLMPPLPPRLSARPRVWPDGGGGGLAHTPPPPPPSPAVVDAARRGFAVGARALAYGGAAGLVGAALAAVLAARAAGVDGGPGSEGAVRAALVPVAVAARDALAPAADAFRDAAAGTGGPPTAAVDGTFAASLAGRLDGQRRRLAARAGVARETD